MPRYLTSVERAGYTIVQDDRERKPWKFLSEKHTIVRRRLKTGDYSIDGWEDKIAIEKKSGWGELLANLSKGDRPRFLRFLQRLSQYEAKVMVIEQPLTERVVHATVQRVKRSSHGKCQLSEDTVWYWVAEIEGRYGIPIIAIERGCVAEVVPKVLDALWLRVKGVNTI